MMTQDPNLEEVPLQYLPLDALHHALGGRMVPFAGYAMPIQYHSIIAEHQWTRASASLFDVSHMGQLVLTGDGADRALEALVPGDIVGLGDGRLRYSMLLNLEGGILDDLMITRRGNTLYLVVNGAMKADDIAHLLVELPEDINLSYLEDFALLAVQGPKAVDALDRIVPGVAALRFLRAGTFSWQGVELWVSRSGYTGEDGFEVSLPAEQAEAFARALLDQPEVKPAGLGARDSLRLEAGLPLYGHDLDEGTTPVEAGLAFVIGKRRRAEGGFPGAERIIGELINGPIRQRVGLQIEGRQPVREGASVIDAVGAAIGKVTSGGFGPALGAPIAMAYVPAALIGTGAITLESRGKPVTATIVDMPFFPKNYVRNSSDGAGA